MPHDLPDLIEPQPTRRPLWFKLLCVAGAAVMFALGVVGWLLPVVTGVPFYVLGLVLLGMASDRVRRWINRAERRLPHRAGRALRDALARLRARRPRPPRR